MKTKLLLITLLPLVGISCISATAVVNKNKVSIEYVSNDEFDAYSSSNAVKDPKIYINENFNDEKLVKSKINEIEILENGEENIIKNDTLEIAGTYNFTIDGVKYNGEIYASKSENLSTIENKAQEIINSINDGTYFDGHNLNTTLTKLQGSFDKTDNWQLINEKKYDAICTDNNEHFGDYSEWQSIFKLNGTKYGTYYYAFVNESYIKPDPKKTDYRTDDLIYKFDPTLGADVEIRDYAPKMKNPTATIGFTVSAGAEVTTDDGSKLNGEISTSYTTLVESPKVIDNGNMTRNYVEICFDYLKPFDNSGQFYDYNIAQTYQSGAYIIKTEQNSRDIICNDDRVVSIQRDGFWSNLLVHFNINKKLTIVR